MSTSVFEFLALPPLREFSWATPATIDWCEPNYLLHPGVAEFWNTLSSLTITLVGLWGMARAAERRFWLISALVAITGLGSVMFHATLSYFWQLSDELPMIWLTLQWIYVLFTVESPVPGKTTTAMVTRSTTSPPTTTTPTTLTGGGGGGSGRSEVRLAIVLFLYAVAWSTVHSAYGFVLAFQTQFIAWVIVGISRLAYLSYYSRYRKFRILQQLAWLYFAATFASCMVWLADKHGCAVLSSLPWPFPNPQCHALWHLGQAYSLVAGGSFATGIRQAYLTRRAPKVAWAFGILPYVIQ